MGSLPRVLTLLRSSECASEPSACELFWASDPADRQVSEATTSDASTLSMKFVRSIASGSNLFPQMPTRLQAVTTICVSTQVNQTPCSPRSLHPPQISKNSGKPMSGSSEYLRSSTQLESAISSYAVDNASTGSLLELVLLLVLVASLAVSSVGCCINLVPHL